MKAITLLVLLFISGKSFSQSSDFVVLKKKGNTIQRFYVGSAIKFISINGQFIEGYISRFRHDSIFLRLGHTGIVQSGFSTKLDTVFYGDYKIHVKDIKLIPNNHVTLASIGNTLFKIGLLAACVVAGNNINVEQKWKNVIQYTSLVGINVLVAQATLFKKKKVTGYQMGKKHQLEYISLGK